MAGELLKLELTTRRKGRFELADEGTLLLDEVGELSAAAQAKLLRVAEVERRYIIRVLEASHWVIEGPQGAAAVLGLHPSTLRSRMRKFAIERP